MGDNNKSIIVKLVLSSQTFVAPVTGWYRFYVGGAAGSGSFARAATASVTGGGGGGFSFKRAWLNAGDSVTITLGSGGAAVTAATANGNSGSTTTVVAPNWTITITGAQGGTYTNTVSATLTAATGGVASGGDINFTGGLGGAISAAYVASTISATGGGGAASPFGNGKNGGSISGTLPASVSYYRATGGGSPFFSAADIVATTLTLTSGGAGTGSSGAASGGVSVGGNNYQGISSLVVDGTGAAPTANAGGLSYVEYGFINEMNPYKRILGGGVSGTGNNTLGSFSQLNAGPGGATGGLAFSPNTNTNQVYQSGWAGQFGATGGIAVHAGSGTGNTFTVPMGAAGRCAGSGGVVYDSSLATVPGSVAGGDGLCVIEMEF